MPGFELIKLKKNTTLVNPTVKHLHSPCYPTFQQSRLTIGFSAEVDPQRDTLYNCSAYLLIINFA